MYSVRLNIYNFNNRDNIDENILARRGEHGIHMIS